VGKNLEAKPKTSEWYTPPWLVAAAAHLLGIKVFDLDPCAGQHTSHAKRGLSEGGLETSWGGNVWLNPPSPSRPWWDKLMDEPGVDRAAYVAYNVDQIAQSVRWRTPMATFPILWIGGRVQWWTSRTAEIVRLTEAWDRQAPEGRSATSAELARETLRLSELPMIGAIPQSPLFGGGCPQHESAVVLCVSPDELGPRIATLRAVALAAGMPESTALFVSRGSL
jgi:hypothetical protein